MKNKPKHTSGPWTQYHTGKGFIIEDAESCMIASIEHVSAGAEKRLMMPNAILLAAAPEMLEALATVYTLPNLQPLFETKYSKALVNDIMKMMQKTISKARGEA